MTVRTGTGTALLVLAMLGLGACEAPRAAPSTSPPTTADAAVRGSRTSTSQPGAAALQAAFTAVDGGLSGRVDGVVVRVAVPPSRYGGCEPLEVLRIVRAFTGAIAADPDAAARFVKDDFMWYAVTEEDGGGVVRRRDVAVYDRASFRALLDARRRQHERLRLVALRINEDGNFEHRLIRMADDLPAPLGGPERVAQGKGKVNCRNGSVVALTLTMSPAPEDYRRWAGAFEGFSTEELRAAAVAAARELRGGR